MGEEDVGVGIKNFNSNCIYQEDRRDCDGDWDTYCMKSSHCQYQDNVRDCDGDIISLCRK